LALTLITTAAQAATPALRCTGMPADLFEVLEVYDAPKGGLEVVTKRPCEQSQTTFSDADLRVEMSIRLPSNGKQEHYLQWRHTGFFLTTYTGGFTDRVAIDCE
jgi:hypothetical protein